MKEKYNEKQKLYRQIKSFYKKIFDMKPFEKYNRSDFFYLVDEKYDSLAVFCDSLIKGNPGIQFFIGKDGLSHLNDLLLNGETYGFDKAFGNLSAVSFVAKDDLDNDDLLFLKEMRCNVTNRNLIIYVVKEGYGLIPANKSDLINLVFLLKYILCLLENDEETLEEVFENEYILQAIFNNEDMRYSVKALQDITFDNIPTIKKAHQPFVDEVIKYGYKNEKCYMTRLYFPVKENVNSHFHSIVFLYLKNEDIWLTNLFDCKPNKIGEYMFSFLDDVFKKHGIFDEVIISDRYLYAGLKKTLNKLKIDVKYERMDNDFSKQSYYHLVEMLNRVSDLSDTLSEITSDDEFDENKFEAFLDKITNFVSDSNELEEEYYQEDDELNDDEEFFVA